MRALFLKEWRQNYLLFLFALIVAGFLPGMYALINQTWVRNWPDQWSLNQSVGVAYVVVQFIIALLAGAGVIASETERGTLPVLLGLPLSRGRIWLTKLAAALTLALSGFAVVMGTGLMVLPQTISQLGWPTIWRDLPVCLALAFFLAFFWSAVLNRTISALLAAIVFGLAIFVGAAMFMLMFGAVLLGGDPLVDLYLWMLSAIPAVLLASYVAFARGAMAGGRRKWWLALVTLLAGVFVTGSLIVEVTRWQTRYQRSRVEQIAVEAATPGGAAIGLFTEGDLAGPPSHVEAGEEMRNTDYRRQHIAVVNLQDGRELLVRRGRGLVAVSKDGKLAALSTGWPTLTWRTSDMQGGDVREVRGVEIWDLERHQRLYRGFPSRFWDKARLDPRLMEWSPDGEWLLMVARNAEAYYALHSDWYPNGPSEVSPFRDDEYVLLLMRQDGSDPTVLECHEGPQDEGPAYAWDLRPGRHGVYAFARDGSLVRHDLDTGKAEKMWARLPAPAGAAVYRLSRVCIAPSPDGTTVAVAVGAYPYPPRPQRKGMDLLVLALPADGTALLKAATTPVARWTAYINHPLWLAWSEDGRSLCAAAAGGRRFEDRRQMLWTMRWHQGSAAALTTVREVYEGQGPFPRFPGGHVRVDARVDGLTAILHRHRFLLWYGGETWFVDESAELQPLPSPLLALGGGFVAFDNQGRAIVVLRGEKSKLAAVDITTGKVTDIYP